MVNFNRLYFLTWTNHENTAKTWINELIYILVNTYILVNKLLKNWRFYLLMLLNGHELTWTYNEQVVIVLTHLNKD